MTRLSQQESNTLDWQSLQARISAEGDHGYWQSLGELADRTVLAQSLRQEFPVGAENWPDSGGDTHTSRRRFLQLMGASLAIAGTVGCRQPEEKVLPYVETPEILVPGKPLYFATAMPQHGFGHGVVVKSHEGRPTKIEGNQLHPASRGTTNALAQASLLTLYDPDRSQVVSERGALRSKESFRRFLHKSLSRLRSRQGRGLRILTTNVTSPTLVRQLDQLREQMPDFLWHHYDPVSNDAEYGGTRQVFGQPLQAVYDFRQADVVLALGGDFLDPNRSPPAYARDFMARRKLAGESGRPDSMNRLYVAEATGSLTGSKADHRFRMSPREIISFIRIVAERLGVSVAAAGSPLPESVKPAWITELVDDLRGASAGSPASAGVVVPGYDMPAEVHALAHAINRTLAGETEAVRYIEPVRAGTADQLDSLRELTTAMASGQVDTLLIVDGNPVFNAPADLKFIEALSQVPNSVHWGLYANDTAAACRWHLPGLHYLEAWSDVRAIDGTASIIQPLIAPLYNGVSQHELLDGMIDEESRADAYAIVRSSWESHFGDADFERSWEAALKEGVIPNTAAEPVAAAYDGGAIASGEDDPSADETNLQIVFRPDPSIDDGEFANNAWLQELPKPHTKLTWDNPALISPRLAHDRGLTNGQMIRLEHQGRQVTVPVWILPGQSDHTITLHFGYGSRQTGSVGKGTGFNVYPLRTTGSFWMARGVQLKKLAETYPLASTQEHFRMEERHPVERGSLEELQQHPRHPPFMHQAHHPQASLYGDAWKYEGYKWGMAVDLTSCIGCNACVTACQAENNIPVVGKEQVAMGREMHWMRIDTYYHGSIDDPATYFQPLMCQHCEKAPCEAVCPVSATTHSEEGINEMTYNRCVGTRYCANNCPYKVRRFNFLQYTDNETPVLQLLRNPNVTVRSRGVMEKCTYCIQRINHARIDADLADGSIPAGGVKTACQAACPTQAIAFGNLNNPREDVVAWKRSSLNYRLLDDLNTEPRTSYLASISNPNPAIAPPAAKASSTH